MLYFGFALADSMLEAAGMIKRTPLDPSVVMIRLSGGYVNACNPSHAATIEAARLRYGIAVASSIPTSPPKVALVPGDSLIIMGVRGLPRLTDRHEYTVEEIAGASFSFALYEVLA